MSRIDIPTPGQIARVRQRLYLVEGVVGAPNPGDSALLDLSCVDDDAQGQHLQVLWDAEIDREVLTGEAWDAIAKRGFDQPQLFSAYLNTLKWNCITSTDPRLFQSPFRAGIRLDAYQLEPLRKALRLPRVNLFIADDVGLGKTIEAGLIARELLLRKKAREIVVCCPPSMLYQWKDELETRFGLTFEILDKDYMKRVRQDRGFGVNPWSTHARFLVSHRLLIDETYAGPLRDWLGDFRGGTLLILDEAHHAAPSSGQKYAIDSHITRAIRDLAPRFEHRLFLSATPHNGHSNSFSALLEILDPQRFCRGVPVKQKMLDDVMVRRLKDDIREILGGFPKRHVEQVDIDGLPADAPELRLSELLDQYRNLREQRLSNETKRKRATAGLLITGLQQRLLSSIEAFARTLRVHRQTVQRQWEHAQTGHAASAPSPAARLDLLVDGVGSDDDRAAFSDEQLRTEEDLEVAAATEATTTALATIQERDLFAREQKLLNEMAGIADENRNLPDARVLKLIDWIRAKMCPGLPKLGEHPSKPVPWNDTRVIIFTEYEDSKRYLYQQLSAAIEFTDRADERIAVFAGSTPETSSDNSDVLSRQAIKLAFNADPSKHPIRILIATDAAREGLNLQAHCWNLFHFDVPWNPSRMEQRNGRIDRKLQPSDDVFCHYFVYKQRPEDRILSVLVRKTETIRRELGSLAQVIDAKLTETLRGGIRRNNVAALVQEIETADLDPDRKEAVVQELDATRERQQALRTQIDTLRSLLEDSQKSIGLDEEHFRSAISCALQLVGAGPLVPIGGNGGTKGLARSQFPALDQREGADPTWADTMDTLRVPKSRDQKPWEWRRTSPIRPVVFKDTGSMDDSVVHLHLEHRVVQRLLGRFTAQGFVHHDLSRACLAQSSDAIPRVVMLGRLCLYGPGAARLHEELVPITARWSDPAIRKGALAPYARESETKTMSILDASLITGASGVTDQILKQLQSSAPRDVQELLPHLQKRGEDYAADARKKLHDRGEAEAKAMREILETQKKYIGDTVAKHNKPDAQLKLGFAEDELHQLNDNRKYWAKRLAALEQELHSEPDRVREAYTVKATRIEPVGLVLSLAGDGVIIMARDPEAISHQEWIGYVQPVGLVVSIPALLAAQAHVNRNILPDHQRFVSCLPRDKTDAPIPEVLDFADFVHIVFGWRKTDLERVHAGDGQFSTLEVTLPEYYETLRPTHVIREQEPKDPNLPWMMLIQVHQADTELDAVATADHRNWQATPQAKFERLLRETRVPLGLLCNGRHIRIVYAPRGETSGYITFSVAEMSQVAGRPIFAALHMLLCEERLFSLGEKQRLPAILADSRKYQNVVSTKLAEQVLAALYELIRGFQAADDQVKGSLLHDVLAEDPNHVYRGLLTVLMRLVFTLFAEDRGLISNDPVYANFYSVTGLFERLRADDGRYPDTMNLRYGAWAQLLTLFRLIYEGGSHGGLKIPPRHGYLFDPDRYNFLEGRPWKTTRDRQEGDIRIPHVSDGVVFRVLSNLLILDGERLSYRTLDVEQIGSVYETVMGFDLHVAAGRSIAIKPAKSHGAPACINLEELLTVKPDDRSKWLVERTDQKLAPNAVDAVKSATTLDQLLAALEKKIAQAATPNVVPTGAMLLQPSDERRRSGSHYTPRSMTQPIVETALRPILQRLGERPTPQQLLDLKVCDPAKGSGAFLVEADRQLADELVKAWHNHNQLPVLPPDEDEVLYARRLIAQRCLYGVDRNPMAVDLAKLSLWLATLAKDHPFTFLDHSLRCGDSLVGLTRKQIGDFHWKPDKQMALGQQFIQDRIRDATAYRQEILAAGDQTPHETKRQKLAAADDRLDGVRFFGDLVIAAFFGAEKDKLRIERRNELLARVSEYLRTMNVTLRPGDALKALGSGPRAIKPFHWEIEFPEVFERENGGFDAIVGNPPFAGKNTLLAANADGYLDWLKTLHDEAHGNADLVAHFFRRAFNLIRRDGTFGLVATNTIGQGDTRSTGLHWICTHGGTIYSARKRYRWPGQASVVVSVLHVCNGTLDPPYDLDGIPVATITAFLFHAGGHSNPASLRECVGKSFTGYYIHGSGFLFADSDASSTPLSTMHEIIRADDRYAQRIHPYIGGEEFLNDPRQQHCRYVIDLNEMTEEEARKWPALFNILDSLVRPARQKLPPSNATNQKLSEYWWKWMDYGPAFASPALGPDRWLFHPNLSVNLAFGFVPSSTVVGKPHNLFNLKSLCAFAALQTRVHEVWARFFSSSLEDRLRYTPTDCFETFPFPMHFEASLHLEAAGLAYFEFRAALMVKNDEGLTKTYNRFHSPDERSSDILKLRELHAAMDRAVLDAYGWTDIPTDCQFLLDYEEEEDDTDAPSSGRGRKKPWRCRWPDEVRDEVLARLLDLNKKRAEQERLSGVASAAATAKAKPRKGKKQLTNRTEGDMFSGMMEDKRGSE